MTLEQLKQQIEQKLRELMTASPAIQLSEIKEELTFYIATLLEEQKLIYQKEYDDNDSSNSVAC